MKRDLSFSKDKIKILLMEGIHQRAVEVLASHGYTQVVRFDKALQRDRLVEEIADAHFIGIRSRTHLVPEVLDAAKKLMGIGCFCIGTNQVDLITAAKKGVPVFNAPHSNTRSVAELVIGETVMLMRGIFPKSMAAHDHRWLKSAKGSFEVRGKTLGIVGYGHIGSQVSVLAEAMGMRVVYFDILSKLPLGNATAMSSMEALLAESQVITLHVPATEQTKNLIGPDQLRHMQPGSFLINASRGNVVDIAALAAALRSEHLAGAALDVYPKEPGSNQEPFESELAGIPSVILTPHIGGSTQEAQVNIGVEVASKLAYFSDRGSTEGSVNFPQVNLSPNDGAHRLLHIHANRPGMLRQINTLLADEHINVLGQHLKTWEEIGYVVLDISKDVPKEQLVGLEKRLRLIEGTIRTRSLY